MKYGRIFVKNSIGSLYQHFNYLQGGWEANQVGTDTESGTRAGTGANTGDVGIEDGESGGGDQSNQSNLIHLEGLLRDGVGSNSDHKTFN